MVCNDHVVVCLCVCVLGGLQDVVLQWSANARVNDLLFNSKLCVLISNVVWFSSVVMVSVCFLLVIRVTL